jgi:hypothetical protein
MGRKSYRTGAPTSHAEQPAAARRYASRSARTAAVKADPISEGQYTHVRQELLRIGLLALALFSSLVVLRIVTTALNLLP